MPVRRVSSVLCSVAMAVLVCAATSSAQSPVPQRIVSLAPSITEVLFEAGLGPRVVGVTSYCRFPRRVLALPKVGGGTSRQAMRPSSHCSPIWW